MPKDVELWPGIRIIAAQPAVYFERIDTLAIADIHLGHEGTQAEKGVLLPKVQLKAAIEALEQVLEKQPVKRLAIVGDIRPGFGPLNMHEVSEIKVFLDWAKKNFQKTIVLRGNHDNYVIRLAKYAQAEFKLEKVLGKTLFLHGDIMPKTPSAKWDTLVMGHEHPALALRRGTMRREKMKAVVWGECKIKRAKKRIIVLPAIGFFAQGTAVNEHPPEELLSPILQSIDMDKLKAVGLLEGEEALEFPPIGKLRKL